LPTPPPLELEGGGIKLISFGFLKKEKRIYSENPEKKVIHKKGKTNQPNI
jgi:hypothetical protein